MDAELSAALTALIMQLVWVLRSWLRSRDTQPCTKCKALEHTHEPETEETNQHADPTHAP